ncbi:MAG: TlpA family protein disulfide reductase [Myxococcales bacterium]|nr:TlpA family protein disulfide reductase [Myxococcales bacterium]
MVVIRLGCVVLGLALGAGQGPDAPTLPPLVEGDLIPTFRLPVENAESWGSEVLDLREWYGVDRKRSEQLVVTFGASWCAPCRLELQELSRRQEELSKASTRVVVVVADREPQGRREMVLWLMEDLRAPFAIVTDEFGILARRFRAQDLPASYLASSSGRLIWVHTGWDASTVPELIGKLASERVTIERRP